MNNDQEEYTQRQVRNRIATGLLLVVIGLVLFADKLGVIIPKWVISWPMLLVVIGLYTGFKHSFQNATWFILVLVGGIFLWDEMMMDLSLKPYIIPIVLVAAGLIVMMRPRQPKRTWGGGRHRRWERWNERAAEQTMNQDPPPADSITGDDYIKIDCLLSGVERTILSKNFKGGRISCIMGGAELDLTKADIQGTAILQLHEIMGGVSLMIPSNWTIQNNISGILHGLEDRRSGQMQPDPHKVLVLQGSAIMAGVEIKSY
ncbi:MAG: DUF5668 domain-containing protein [Ferruginibacter sp.]